MSTSAVIARQTASGFVGRYHHNGGNPHLLGRALFLLRNGFFQGDTAAMLRVLVDEHSAGWSDITNKDFSLAPGFVTLPDCHRPLCYCHGERRDPSVTFTEISTPMIVDVLYVINSSSHSMDIFVYRWPQEGEPARRLLGSVSLDGPEPSWRQYRRERIFYEMQEWDELDPRPEG